MILMSRRENGGGAHFSLYLKREGGEHPVFILFACVRSLLVSSGPPDSSVQVWRLEGDKTGKSWIWGVPKVAVYFGVCYKTPPHCHHHEGSSCGIIMKNAVAILLINTLEKCPTRKDTFVHVSGMSDLSLLFLHLASFP